MFPSFATREALFTSAKYVSAPAQQEHISMLQNWGTLGEHVSAANVSVSLFPRFGRAF